MVCEEQDSDDPNWSANASSAARQVNSVSCPRCEVISHLLHKLEGMVALISVTMFRVAVIEANTTASYTKI